MTEFFPPPTAKLREVPAGRSLPCTRMVPARSEHGPTAEPDVRPLHAKACGCVDRPVVTYSDEDGDVICIHCGDRVEASAPVVVLPLDDVIRSVSAA